MSDSYTSRILVIIDITALVIGVHIAFIYVIPIIFIRRFHTTNNILTGNVCLATIFCASFWIFYNVLTSFYPMAVDQSVSLCFFASYTPILVNSLWVYSFTIVTINRYMALIHPNRAFFKKQTCSFMFCAMHWLFCIIISLPYIYLSIQSCQEEINTFDWNDIYALVTVIVLPTILTVIFNSLIYVFVRASTRRIQAVTTIANKPTSPNTRDIHLLKHMCFTSIIFILGWAPVYILPIIQFIQNISLLSYRILQVLPVISSIIIVCDLFYYNHDLRQYLTEKLSNIIQS